MTPIGTHWKNLEELVLVAGHAVYLADDFSAPVEDRSWWLQSFQTGEPPFYVEHILCGVEIAAAHRKSLLVFSGGQTRFEAGPRTEAQSYWAIANHFAWWQRPSIKLRATTEEFARDSFENLLFGICRFHESAGRYPESIKVVSWAFKEQRFDLHRAAIRWGRQYQFIGVNNPVDLDAAQKGEAKALSQFREDPFGTNEAPPGTSPEDRLKYLGEKRRDRNPFNRHDPYAGSCTECVEILKHKTSEGRQFTGSLPW